MNPKRSKPKNDRTMPMIQPNAAAIDIGATMHTAAVRADRMLSRSAARDLHNRSASAGRLVYRMWRRDSRYGVDQRLLDPDIRTPRRPWLCCVRRQCPRCQARTRTQDRCQRRAVATAPSFLRSAGPAFGPKARSLSCEHTCVSASACSSMRPPISSTCRRP